jgi:hypothetical protein
MNIKSRSKKATQHGTSVHQASLTSAINGFGALRSVLERACTKAACSLGDLTVLSAQVDPYRLDTPSGHRDGKWIAEHFDRLVGGSKKIHWRGLQVLVAASALVKPNGDVYALHPAGDRSSPA